jgi:acyl-CoA thioesterase-1
MYQAVAIFLMALGLAFPSVSAAEPIKLVVLGDSLSAGYQLPPDEAFPVQLEGALKAKGHDVVVVNAAVSGDTTSGGLARLDWSVGEDADAVIVELGANDALRGLPPETTRGNLNEIVARLTGRGIEVLVAGMLAPRNLGSDFAKKFDPIFADVARDHGALHYPFFLEGVALKPELNLSDGMHPTGEGVSVIVGNVLPLVEQLLSRSGAS